MIINHSLYISELGWKAYQSIAGSPAEQPAGSVLGVTSRGIFVQIADRLVVFLSRETYRGPLTVNLGGRLDALEAIKLHAPVEVQDGTLLFRQAGIALGTQASRVWRAPAVDMDVLPPSERLASLKATAGRVIELKNAAGFSAVLGRLVGLSPLPWNDEQEHTWQAVQGLRQAVLGADVEGALSSLLPVIGRGGGLTPSGDDLVMGLLLALNRWGRLLGSQISRDKLNQALIEATATRTTALSANLIECAALGEADERLVDALDGVVSGKNLPPVCAAKLAAWGNSSGLDALTGMAVVVGE